MNKREFINIVVPGTVEAYKKYGILPSLILAQAALESNWGNAAPGNMLFGIKWTEGCGYDWQLLWTSEYINGKQTKLQAKFRKYNFFAESILDHSQLLLKPRYAKVLAAKNYKEACYEVWKAGYATDPNYTEKLITIIERNKFYEYDDEAKNQIKLFLHGKEIEAIGSLKDGVYSVPIRFFEQLGYKVNWQDRVITIDYK